MKRLLIILLLIFLTVSFTDARTARSAKARRDFVKLYPCPSTGKTKGACPGYVVDHRIGLCVGGEDTPSNMRWMTKDAAKEKDQWECKPGWEDILREEDAKAKGSRADFRIIGKVVDMIPNL